MSLDQRAATAEITTISILRTTDIYCYFVIPKWLKEDVADLILKVHVPVLFNTAK